VACSRVNFTFTFRLERITAIHNIETPEQKLIPGTKTHARKSTRMINRVKIEVKTTSVDEGRNGKRNVEYQFRFRIHDIPKELHHVNRSEIFNSYSN